VVEYSRSFQLRPEAGSFNHALPGVENPRQIKSASNIPFTNPDTKPLKVSIVAANQ